MVKLICITLQLQNTKTPNTLKPQYIRLTFILISLGFINILSAQEDYFDQKTKRLLDSLDKRISYLEIQVPKLSENRDAKYFATKRELDMTIFVRNYEEYLFDEDLDAAEQLIESRIQASEKRTDQFAVDYYHGYALELTKIRGQQQARYQKLFAKEKNFKNEWEKFIKVGDEYSLTRALRMVDLAIKYAQDKHLTETLKYLYRYRDFTEALVYDFHSSYDLEKLTSSESVFLKTFEPLINSDSLKSIQEGIELVNACYEYAASAKSVADTIFFGKQKIAAANAVADWNQRQGMTAELALLTGQAVLAQLDSINKEGIYIWKGKIVVIGSLTFTSKSENVRRGEAIINADRRLMDYIRINKIAKISSSYKIGKTVMLPYVEEGKPEYFLFDRKLQKWQYMVSYSSVINERVTKDMIRFLLPMQFKEEIKNGNGHGNGNGNK